MKSKKANLKKTIAKSHIFEVYPATIIKIDVGMGMPSILGSFPEPPVAYFTFKFKNKGGNKVVTIYSTFIEYEFKTDFMKLCHNLCPEYDVCYHLMLSSLIGKQVKLKVKIETIDGELDYKVVGFSHIII